MNSFTLAFNRIASKFPENIAVLEDGKSKLTYNQISQSSAKLAEEIKALKLPPGSLIGLKINKSINYIIALLACWKTGMAFIPLGPEVAKQRLEYILKEAAPNAIINNKLKITKIHNTKNYAQDTAYVIYTSGSTGKPKGVIISHQGITNLLVQQIKMFKLNDKSRMLFYLSINFDASLSDIGVTLLSGACLVIETKSNITTAANIFKIMSARKITHIDIPPSLLNLLDINKAPQTLQTIIIGGERCSLETIKKWSAKYRLVNVYGPTEATICTSMKLCSSDYIDASIGSPISNIEYTILTKVGSTGELCISGLGLAKGYVKNKKLNAAKFLEINNKIYYRTGDLVKQQYNGEFIFIGRIDRQVKIRGQLLAPEEIESNLASFPKVHKVAVITKSGQLIAFVETKIGFLNENTIKSFLKSRLPVWMIPTKIISLKTMPLLPNKKIDLAELQNYKLSSSKNNSIKLVTNPLTKKLQKIWQQTLQLNYLPSTEANFFDDLGGDSLAVLKMVMLAETEKINLPVELIYRISNIRDLTFYLDLNNDVDALSTSKLKTEATSSPIFNGICCRIKTLPQSTSQDFLLTGATGYLGIYVLHQLLNQTSSRIFCILRAKKAKDALRRIEDISLKYNLPLSNAQKSRIITFPGDVTKPLLGTSQKTYNELAKNVGQIFHCAGAVNMIQPFEILKSANLESTWQLTDFATTLTLKKFYFASTLSVFAASDKNSGSFYESDNLSASNFIYGGYAQTKWAAEYYIQKLNQNNFGAKIFRFGLLTGYSSSGICSPHDYLATFVNGLLKIGHIPDLSLNNLKLDATPVDYAANAMVHLAINGKSQCYHIVNKSKFSLTMILSELKISGHILKKISLGNWLRKTADLNLMEPQQIAAYMAMCRLYEDNEFQKFRNLDLFQSTDVTFNQTNSQSELKKVGIICPKADKKLLNKYISVILNGS